MCWHRFGVTILKIVSHYSLITPIQPDTHTHTYTHLLPWTPMVCHQAACEWYGKCVTNARLNYSIWTLLYHIESSIRFSRSISTGVFGPLIRFVVVRCRQIVAQSITHENKPDDCCSVLSCPEIHLQFQHTCVWSNFRRTFLKYHCSVFSAIERGNEFRMFRRSNQYKVQHKVRHSSISVPIRHAQLNGWKSPRG